MTMNNFIIVFAMIFSLVVLSGVGALMILTM